MQNITFRADRKLIERARRLAQERSTSMNELFNEWLEELSRETGRAAGYDELMQRLQKVESGGPFSRDELNER